MDICFRWILSRVQFGQSLKVSALILRVLFSFDVSNVFGGVSEVVSKFLVVPTWSGFSPIQHTWVYPILSLGLIFFGISALLSLSGLWPSDLLFGGASCRLLIPKLSLILGVFRSSRKDWFLIASNVLGYFLPAFYFFVLRQRRFHQAYSLLNDQKNYCSRCLLVFCE